MSCGSTFHSFGAAIKSDWSPRVTLVRRDGIANSTPPGDRKLYAPHT